MAPMPKLKHHELAVMPDDSMASKDIFDDPHYMEETPRVWLLRYGGFSRLTTDPQEVDVAKSEGACVIEYMAVAEEGYSGHPQMNPTERLQACEEVLRSLASYLSAGGYNADYVDPKVFHEKILWGIQQIQQGEMI